MNKGKLNTAFKFAILDTSRVQGESIKLDMEKMILTIAFLMIFGAVMYSIVR